MADPHSVQNFAPAIAGEPHLAQAGARSELPHSLQNLAPATTAVPHCGQCFAPTGVAGAG